VQPEPGRWTVLLPVDNAGMVSAERPTVPGMPPQPGPTAAPVVPGYVLEDLLGRGGSGQVWRARPRGGGSPVAVKVLVRGDPERQEREAALLGELDHPHLVRLHEVVRREVRGAQAQVSLVLDLLEGGSLAALLARRDRLRPGEVVTTVAPIAAALAHAHERGVVHGDLSPGNVVFTAEGRPVLTDLGTARLVGDAARAEVTPPYVDPVVARGGAPGPASDVFGVAAAAFHALTGIAPWNAADPAGTLGVAAAGQLPDLAVLAPEAPEELVRVVLRGLSGEPHERGSAASFALDLRHACRPEPVRLPVAGVPDAELAVTGRGPRTELTHQVPGRRSRAAHAAAEPEGRLARVRARLTDRSGQADGQLRSVLRRVAVTGATALAVTGALVGAVWLGTSWGRPADPLPAAVAGPVPTSAPTTTPGASASAPPTTATPPSPPAGSADPAPPAPATSPPPVSPSASAPPSAAAPLSPADRGEEPVDDAGWAALVADLYGRRAAAFGSADPAALAGVYAPDSPLLTRDTDQLEALATAGREVEGFDPQVRELVERTVESPGRVRVVVVDALSAYRLVPAPAADPSGDVQLVPGRGDARVELVLVGTGEGWRIAEAHLLDG
jgi:hypothetical protein